MKLCAYLINGTPLNQLDKYLKTDLNGNKAFEFIEDADPIPSGYQDISSIMNWWNFGTACNKDYKVIRDEIIVLAATIGWSNLTSEEKSKTAEIFAVGQTERDEIYTLDEQINLGMNHHIRSMESRKMRAMIVQMHLFNRLSKADWEEVANDTEPLLPYYLEQGREGTVEGDSEGLFDYVDGDSRSSHTWDGTGSEVGFRNKTYTVSGYSNCSDFADVLLDILKYGKY